MMPHSMHEARRNQAVLLLGLLLDGPADRRCHAVQRARVLIDKLRQPVRSPGLRKLDDGQLREINTKAALGHSIPELAEAYGVERKTIYHHLNGSPAMLRAMAMEGTR